MTIRKDEEQVTGFQPKHIVGADRMFGADVASSDIRLAEMPDGVKFFIRNQPVDMGAADRIEFLLYEIFPVEGATKFRRQFIEKVIHRIPDDDYIKSKWGPNEHGYQWQAKWLDAGSKEEKTVLSPFIYISGRAVLAAPVSVAPAAAAPAAFGFKEIMEMQALAEEKAIKSMERIAALLKANQAPGADEVMGKGVQAVERMMVALVDSQLNTVRKVGKMAQERIEEELGRMNPADEEEEEEEAEPAPRSSGMPQWLEMLWPHVEGGLKHLTGGGPTAAIAKNLILGTEEFKAIFNDKEKFAAFETAARAQFGDEQVDKALKILLNKRDEKKAGKKSSGK